MLSVQHHFTAKTGHLNIPPASSPGLKVRGVKAGFSLPKWDRWHVWLILVLDLLDQVDLCL